MPELSRFYGIIVRMFSEPTERHHMPHIHVEYQEHQAVYDLNGDRIDGNMPARQEKLIRAWMVLHEEELRENWKRLSTGKKSRKIAPLR